MSQIPKVTGSDVADDAIILDVREPEKSAAVLRGAHH
jgi:hypothetical protein